MTEGKLVRRECFMCGKTFYASNPTAKFDTPLCRLKAFRWRSRLKRLPIRMVRDLAAIEEYLGYADSHDLAAATIAQLHRRLEIALKAGNIRKIK